MKVRRRYHPKSGDVYYTVGYSKVYHREDGPAIIFSSGTKYWLRYGLLHRSGGPAAEFSGGTNFTWYVNGRRHREDGPAVIHMNGEIEWWLDGDSCNKETWFKNLPEDKKLEQLYSKYFIEG